MKKGIIIAGIVGIIAISGITLLIVNGSGNKESDNVSNNTEIKGDKESDNVSYNTEIKGNVETELGENITSNPYSSTGESVAISKFICPFSGGIALVDSKGKQYVIDEKGNVLFDFTSQYKEAEKYNRTDEITIKNGYIFNCNEVYDKNGKQTYKALHSIVKPGYGDRNISKSGYFSGYKMETQFEGTSSTYFILDPTGKTIVSHSKNDGDVYMYIDEDIFYYTDNNDKDHYIDAKKGEELSDLTGTVVGNTIVEKYEESESIQVLNSDYYIGKSRYGGKTNIYRVGDARTPGKTPVKEFGESGLKYIVYYKDVYYVCSETGYLYTMDKNFNNIAEPVKIERHDTFYLTSKGVLIEKDDNYIIIDKNLNEIEKLASVVNGKEIEKDFICVDLAIGRHSYQETKFIYFADGSYYDVDAQYYYEMINL